jgi:single-stranded DNA-binding protein
MNLEVTGKLLVKYDTQVVSDKFKKREFVLELADDINGNTYTNYAKMQLVQAKCDIIDRFNEGDQVKVSFNIKGNRWERDGKVNFITNLDAWRIEPANAGAPANNGGYNQQPAYNQQPQQNYGNAPAYSNNNGGQPFYNPSPESADDLPF